MTIRFRALIHCDAQRSVRCHGLFTVEGSSQALSYLATTTLERNGWRRIPKYLETTRDVCPACQEAERP